MWLPYRDDLQMTTNMDILSRRELGKAMTMITNIKDAEDFMITILNMKFFVLSFFLSFFNRLLLGELRATFYFIYKRKR